MCGVAGFLHLVDEPVDCAELNRVRDVMVHRGPDGAGTWVSPCNRVGLAHRRLSIIDLSKAAAQPMANAQEDVVITFNGEIYNHLSLRKELEEQGFIFRTDHSDTEVLVHGFRAWGWEVLLQRIEGDYAFGLWDALESKLYLARDRIGVKPLYFSFQNFGLIFASEIKAILAHSGIRADIEPLAMYHYLSFMTTPPPLTMFEGIYKLPPGHWLSVSQSGEVRSERYWEASPGRSGIVSAVERLSPAAREDLYIREIRRRLEESVEKRMMSDVPFGVFLSGGIDSSTNVALMNRFVSKPLQTFSVGFRDNKELNELEYARQVSREFKTDHHEVLINVDDMSSYLAELIYTQDEPIADWVCIPLFFVTKLTREAGVTVVQVGEGSDEQFCGYESYMAYLNLYRHYWSPFRRFLPGFLQALVAKAAGTAAARRPGLEIYADIVERAARDREHFWTGATAYWDIKKRQLINPGALSSGATEAQLAASGLLPDGYLEPDSFNVIRGFRSRMAEKSPGADVLTRMIYNEFQLRLPELLLMRVDKITMSQSIEARVPFLDHHLVELTMDIPMQDKIRPGVPKYLLKKVVEGLIPHNIIYRKKMGFAAPMSSWLRGEFGKRAEREILNSSLLERGFFNVDYIRSLIKDHRDGRRDNSLYIWVLYNLFRWYDYWVAAESPV